MPAFTSCEWDTSPEYDHPLYVTYSITAGIVSYDGPEALLLDFQSWVKENQNIYDKQVNYSKGEASEFAKADAEAIKKYEEFAPKFQAYLADLKKRLEGGAYSEDITGGVTATFFTSAARTQGESGHLKYDQIEFTYHP